MSYQKKNRKFEQYSDMIARLFPVDMKNIPKEKQHDYLTRSVTFQVTDDCNLACKYCYQINKGKRKMSFDTAKKFVDLLLSGEKGMDTYINPEESQGIILEFIGGEPFLEIELIDKIVDYFKMRTIELMHPWATKYCISICSNGVLYFDERVQKFLQKNKDNISFSITIDGNKELHDSCRVFHDGVTGSYDMAVKGAMDWMSRGNYMGSKITIAPENLKHLHSAITHMVELGYDDINANCVYEEGWTKEHATEFYSQLKNIADYFIENDLVENTYLALFNEEYFKKKDEEDNSNWCFKAGTMVLTPNGNVPIETLKINDQVITGSGNISKVSNIMKHNADNTAILCAAGIYETYTTLDHPYLAKRFLYTGNKGVAHYSEPEWVKAEDLKPKDKIALKKHIFGNVCYDKDLAYLIGRYVGDGWHSTTGYKLCCSFDEFEELKGYFDKAHIHYSYDKYRTVMQFNIFAKNNELLEVLTHAGNNALNKRVPKEVFTWNEESVQYFLKGLFDADGYNDIKHQCVKFNTVSRTLANDVLLLLRGFSLYPTCYLYKRAGESMIEGRKVNIHDRYEVYCCYDNTKTRSFKNDPNDDIIWASFRSVTPTEPYEVYNLTVENEHTFIANNAIVHNCGGTGLMLSCDPDGYLYPCIRYMESSLGCSQKPLRIGDVDNGLAQREEEKKCVGCLKCITRRSQSTDECFNCPIGEGCAWCSAYNYQVYGTPNKRATYICEMHKARALANVYFWNTYYRKKNINKRFECHCPKEWALNIIPEDEYEMLINLSK